MYKTVLPLIVLLLATPSAKAEQQQDTHAGLSHDVRQLSGLLAEQATRASRSIDSHTEAVRVKGVFEDALNDLARANSLIAVPTVQTFADKKQIGIGFVTISKPSVIIQIAARDGELLIERATVGDQTLVDYDWRKSADGIAQEMKRIALATSNADAGQAEKIRSQMEQIAKSDGFTLVMVHDPGFCSITMKRPGTIIHVWAVDGEGFANVEAE